MGPGQFLQQHQIDRGRKKKLKTQIVYASFFAEVRDLFGLGKRESSCQAVDLNSSYVEPEQVLKDKFAEMLQDYYYYCLKPYYKYGYADLDGSSNSESQSYALLQAYWMDDRRTFSKVWRWTDRELRREDNLFSWDFDLKREFSSYPYKIAVIKDGNSATDADLDIAFALLKAGEDWGRDDYLQEGKLVINGIWEKEVSSHQGKYYLLPGAWGANETEIVINPSYFSPAAFRLFAKYDPGHDWLGLAKNSYEILEDIRNRLNRGSNNEFPPNWVVLDKASGQYRPFLGKNDSSDYSYDAFRTLWRASYDQLTSPNFDSWNYVSSFNNAIDQDWNDEHNLCSLYVYRNNNLECDTRPTGLAGKIGALSVTNGWLAEQAIKRYYIHDNKLKFPEDSFYARSWHWFGSYLWDKS